ncbi:ThiF family adenylyltransferase [Leptospira sp. WS39.C2]
MNPEKNNFFKRQSLIPSIGEQGLKKWNESSVLIVGLGGLGCPAALQLVLSGIGRIGLVDFDIVEVTNLHRQTLFKWKDVGRKKIEVVEEVLKEHAPWLEIETFSEIINSNTNDKLFDSWDIVVDCTDTISSKYALNNFCLNQGIPLVTASVFRTSAQFAIFSGKGKPCYRCLFPKLDEGDTLSCNEGGVLGVQTTLTGSYQASLVLEYLLDPNLVDLKSVYFMEWSPISLYQTHMEPNPECPSCGSQKQNLITKVPKLEITFDEFLKLKSTTSVVLLDVRENEEILQSPIADSIWFPLSELEKGKLPTLQNNQTIVCICESGVRSLKALSYFPELIQKYSLLGGRRIYALTQNTLNQN